MKPEIIESKIKSSMYHIEAVVQIDLVRFRKVNLDFLNRQQVTSYVSEFMACPAVATVFVRKRVVENGHCIMKQKVFERTPENMKRFDEMYISKLDMKLPEVLKGKKRWSLLDQPVSTQAYIMEKIDSHQKEQIAADLEQAGSGQTINRYGKNWRLSNGGIVSSTVTEKSVT